jgi:hypothetical protein
MDLYSTHVFLYPFQWDLKQDKETVFGKRYHLSNINLADDSPWQRKVMNYNDLEKIELYDEKNFFYEFVHNALYDVGQEPQPVVRHFERKECTGGQIHYSIEITRKNKILNYILNVRSITLDLFSSGVGMLFFYMDNHQYPSMEDVKNINHYGSRIFPRYFSRGQGVNNLKDEGLADSLSITGLIGDARKYAEDFSTFDPTHTWQAARFLNALIGDVSPALMGTPLADDSMFTMCWYLNDEMGLTIEDDRSYSNFVEGSEWYAFVYASKKGSNGQNTKRQAEILERQTYPRWQNYGTLFGITRNTFMVISKRDEYSTRVLINYFRTIYTRLASLALMQRISILRFSAEVTRISTLAMDNATKMVDRIDDFYMAYIRFVNQSHFLEVTGQQHGIDLYDLLLDSMRIKEQVQDLDNEVEELHKFAAVLEEKSQGRNIKLLTLLGSLFLVPSFIAGFYGMNLFPDEFKQNIPLLTAVIVLIFLIAGGLWGILSLSRQENKKFINFLIAAIILMVIIVMGLALGAAMQS